MKFLLLALLRAYRRFVSPLLPQACRFHPTCSSYATEAIQIHGSVRGGLLAIKRISRCQPFSPGGLDPVPALSSGQSLQGTAEPSSSDSAQSAVLTGG